MIHGFLSVIKYGHAQRDSAAPYWTDNDNTTKLYIGCRITWDDLKLRVTTMWNSEHYILHKSIHTHSNLKCCACFKPPLIAPDSHYCLKDLKHILFITSLTFNFISLIKQSARNVTPETEAKVESIALWDHFPSSYAGSVAWTSSQR